MRTEVYPYELLIRLDKNGSAAAHRIDVEAIFDAADNLVSEREIGPVPVAEAELAAFLGADAAQTVAANETLRAERDAAQAACATAEAARIAAETNAASLLAAVETQQAQIVAISDDRDAQLSEKDGEIAALQAALESAGG